MNGVNLNKLVTESRNKNTKNIDKLTTVEMLRLINNEDKSVPLAVEKEIYNIAKAIDIIAEAVQNGGRLIYCGAGTSGRLGVLDASECPPTYGVDSNLVQALIAGGKEAMFNAIEGAEDSKELCAEELKSIKFSSKDVLVGIAASGRTPYVIGGLEYAKSIQAKTISLTCNPDSEISKIADIAISPVVGPEVVTGSTRMKAGTAQKLVLNMISTGVMIKIGKVFGNLMVDVKASNEKLIERAKRIVVEATGASKDEASRVLEKTNYNVKLSIFMIVSNLEMENAKIILNENYGYIAKAIESIKKEI
ncbi:N-acetylmuramic acid 6-phosphate etherase [Clostridium intestinale]|uniref:N-acetylmuramic acid 6-phosphate etherase n=1 Tax=Clostridium intestinale TaxID=36845 RepID=A0A7D6ZHD8_9CLOT|nr:N-acetylmuramic acid 6-phosphate etherase [Clostridium intestinale]QLY80481.1 N-acetylmuramic acid 6-phosphate etherase [Clostridium intestinale]